MAAPDPAVAIAEAARHLEDQLAMWVLEGRRPRFPRASMPRWWTSGLATAALWGSRDILEYLDDDDYPWAFTLLEGEALDAAIDEIGAGAWPFAELHGGSWLLFVEAGDDLPVIKHDRVEDEVRPLGPLVDVLAAVQPMTTTYFEGGGWVELPAEHTMISRETDDAPEVERRFDSNVEAVGAYFELVKAQIAAGRAVRRHPAGFAKLIATLG